LVQHAGFHCKAKHAIVARRCGRTWLVWRASRVDANALDEIAAIRSGECRQMWQAIARLMVHADMEAPLAVTALTEWRSTHGHAAA
jgi:hypothetical protein